MSRTEAKFEAILEGALSEARNVKCPASEFRSGLRAWVDEIQAEITASEESDGVDAGD